MNYHINRRDFLRIGLMTAGAAAMPGTLQNALAAKSKNIPVGTQLWCVRKQLVTDIPGTLSALARIGYQGVELENYFGKSAKEWKTWLDDNKLKAIGSHIYLEAMMGDKLKETVEFNQTIGNKNLVVRMMKKDVYTNKDVFNRTLEQYNEISEKLKPYGMRVAYHNHTDIFNKFDGEYLINLFADKTRKDVKIQFDTGNASEVEGVNVVDVIRRDAQKIISMHVKPHSKAKPDAYLGDDELDWKTILGIVEKAGVLEWYIIEYEREIVPPLESLKANFDNFQKMRKQFAAA